MRHIRAFGRVWIRAAVLAAVPLGLLTAWPLGTVAAPLFPAEAALAARQAGLAAPREVAPGTSASSPKTVAKPTTAAANAPGARQGAGAPPAPAARKPAASQASPSAQPTPPTKTTPPAKAADRTGKTAASAKTPPAKAAPDKGGPPAASGSTTPAPGDQGAQLEKAVRDLSALADAPAAKREAWSALEDRFKKLTASSATAVAAKAQYYVGRLREEAGDRFRADAKGGEADYRQACAAYDLLLRRFPRSGLADDALYRQAAIQAEQLGDAAAAQKSLEFLLAEYPSGDMAPKAKALLAEQAKAARVAQGKAAKGARDKGGQPERTKDKARPENAALPDPPSAVGSSPSGSLRAPLVPPPGARSPAEAPKPSPPSLKTPVRAVTALKVQNADNFARVILDLDGAAEFSCERLVGKNGQAGDLRVTFSRLKAPAQVKAKRVLKDGLLRQLALAADGKELSTLTIDASSLGRYKAYAVEDPYRVYIDLFPASAQSDLADAGKSKPADDGRLDGVIEVKSGARKQAANLVEQLGLTVRRIMIDAGHGGKDPGAMCFGLKEKDVNLRVAFLLGSELRARGFEVLYTRQKDVFIPLEDRPVLANKHKADMFISIHCNAAPDASASGLETYTLNLAKTADASRVAARENAASARTISDLQVILADLMLSSKKKESDDLAHFVQGEIIRCARRSNFALRDHGAKEAPFYVLMGARMPAVLVEIGYITNRDEADRMNSDSYLRAVAVGLAEGVAAYKAKIERFASL